MKEYILYEDELPVDLASLCKNRARQEIVRCMDCKHQDPERFDDGEGNYVCRKGHGWKPDNWFCADGERKDGGK